jgi:cytochrome c oxidase accessory protein FixG
MSTRIIPIVPAPNVAADVKIQARSITGRFTRWRWAMVWLTQLGYYGLPWLQLNGRQALLFDLQADRFFLFGAVLYPQDLIYLAGLLVISAMLLFFVTTLAGRLWCGFTCPQTVYTELFQWIEHRLEGDRQARLRLDNSPWNAHKLARRGGKHLGWFVLSLWTGFTLVGYFTPIRELATAVPFGLGPWEAFWIGF